MNVSPELLTIIRASSEVKEGRASTTNLLRIADLIKLQRAGGVMDQKPFYMGTWEDYAIKHFDMNDPSTATFIGEWKKFLDAKSSFDHQFRLQLARHGYMEIDGDLTAEDQQTLIAPIPR